MAIKFNGLNNLMAGMTPKAKQYTIIGIVATVFLGAIYLVSGGSSKGPEVRWNPKTDRQVNVLTNDNQKNMGLDAMAGRIKYLDSENRKLNDRVNSLIKERQSDKADNSKEREWREKFDALTSEVNKIRAQQRDVNVRINSQGGGSAKSSGGEHIDDPFQVQERKRKALLGDELENQIRNSAPYAKNSGKTGSGSAPSGTRSAARKTLTINVVEDEAAAKADDDIADSVVEQQEEAKAFIPAGSILTGTIITGADFPTGNQSRENPTPTLIRLSKQAILPNRYRSDVRECFMLASGHGELSTERASLRAEMISCIRNDGSLIQTKINGYVAGEDGKAGLKGRLVSKTGQMIARTMAAGFLSGISEAFDYDPVNVLSTTATNNVQYQQKWSADAAKGGVAKGLNNALSRISEYYMQMADQMYPVVEITAGRQIDVIIIQGTYLDVLGGTKSLSDGGITTKGKTMRPTVADKQRQATK